MNRLPMRGPPNRYVKLLNDIESGLHPDGHLCSECAEDGCAGASECSCLCHEDAFQAHVKAEVAIAVLRLRLESLPDW